jgi:hypothetical protein
MPAKITSKMLGDAGEHYAVSQFTFAKRAATKMPDGWEGYDLAVETGNGLVRVSVKTRSESPGWKTSSWFIFDDRRPCDWLVFVFQQVDRQVRAWVIPFGVALEHANKIGKGRKDPHLRDISWKRLNTLLARYENNWSLEM